MSEKTLRTALWFAARGFPIMPLWWPIQWNGKLICACHKGGNCDKSPGKHPLAHWKGRPIVPNGKDSATTESGVIKHWFQTAPEANLGVVIPPGVMVLDFDPRNGGLLEEFEQDHEPLPPSWRTQTGSMGWHCFFRIPDGVVIDGEHYDPRAEANGQTFAGVDILTAGSYVVAPPSLHVSGRRYCWSVDHHPGDIPLAEAPDWLIERLSVAQVGREGSKGIPLDNGEALSAEAWNQLVGGEVRDYRDKAALSIMGHLLRHWVDPGLAYGLLAGWNFSFCKPPLGDQELRQIVNRAARYESERRDREGKW